MGLFSFIAEAGEKLGITPKHSDQEKTAAVQKHLQEKQIAANGVDVAVSGNTVVVSGKGITQEMKEKIILATGNIAGIESVEDKVEATDAHTAAQFYTVQKGDTLSKIAQHFYGKASAYNTIFEANKPMLKNADAIYPGQQLRIPADTKAAA